MAFGAEADLEKLRLFAQAMFDLAGWPDGGDIDAGSFQDTAVDLGLLREVEVVEPCRDEGCFCAECGALDDDLPAICYRKTALLTGAEAVPGDG